MRNRGKRGIGGSPGGAMEISAFGGVFELLEGAAGAESCDVCEAVDEKGAVEVVGFVLKDGGGEVGGIEVEGVFVDVESLNGADGGPSDLGADAGNGEAAFFDLGDAFEVGKLGVDEGLGVFGLAGEGDDDDAEGDADLGSGESDAAFVDHDIDHAVDEAADFVADAGDRLGFEAEDRVRVVADAQQAGLRDGNELRIHGTLSTSEGVGMFCFGDYSRETGLGPEPIGETAREADALKLLGGRELVGRRRREKRSFFVDRKGEGSRLRGLWRRLGRPRGFGRRRRERAGRLCGRQGWAGPGIV